MSKTILVVDDEEAILEILETNLVREGFIVLTADCGEAALLKARQGKPELILLDVGLPDMDGFTVCQKLRETTDVPVIMVTARGEDIDKIHGLETGADDYVVKPFNPKELVARIKAIFRRQETTQKPASNRRGKPRQRTNGRKISAATSTRTSTAKSLSTRPARYTPMRLKENDQMRLTMSR